MKVKILPLSFLIAVLLIGCATESKKTGQEAAETVEIPYRDLAEIKKDGVLHAITTYSSTSYFLYKGMPMGFEYELLSRLADDLGLELKITIAENFDDLIAKLNRGEVDLIAYGLTITKPRQKLVSFTEYHYVTHQTLVQRMPKNWRSLPGYKIDQNVISNTLELIDDTVWVRENTSYEQRLQNLQDEIGEEIPLSI